MFISILLKSLFREFETFCALVKFTKETMYFDEVKVDLIISTKTEGNQKQEKPRSIVVTKVNVICEEDLVILHLRLRKKREQRPGKPRNLGNIVSDSNAVKLDIKQRTVARK